MLNICSTPECHTIWWQSSMIYLVSGCSSAIIISLRVHAGSSACSNLPSNFIIKPHSGLMCGPICRSTESRGIWLPSRRALLSPSNTSLWDTCMHTRRAFASSPTKELGSTCEAGSQTCFRRISLIMLLVKWAEPPPPPLWFNVETGNHLSMPMP
jgi:hypothetical protein